MEKRMILAVTLSLGILLLFQHLYRPPGANVAPAGNMAQSPMNQGVETVMPATVQATSASLMVNEKEKVVETEKHIIVFTDVGGDIKEWRLKEFTKEGKEETLINEDRPGEKLFSLRSLERPGIERAKYRGEEQPGTIEYTTQLEEGIRITKRYSVANNSDHIGLSLSIQNTSGRPVSFSYELAGPSGLQEIGEVKGRSFYEIDAEFDGAVVRKKSVKNAWEQTGEVSWVGARNRYFAVILRPFTNPTTLLLNNAGSKKITTTIVERNHILAPGETLKREYGLYVGPIDAERLKRMGYGMEKMINYGWFGGLSKVFLSILRVFHKWVKNWGVAIILLTLLINLLTFPLTMKSFTSMHQMKKVQPHMQKLKDLHKDNPQKLNKEMMELYKKYNVNPFGGCLPMVLQIPVFIALYQGLIQSVELKGARFLWVKDLATPDAATLPFALPLIGNHLNILPLFMVIMMFVQQKITQGGSKGMVSKEQESQQKMMMLMMPVFFGFLFYNMPSGLVLYWLTNTVLMTGEQAFLSKASQE